MRDPNRIPAVLDALESIWRLHADWRLGQLISNIATWAEQDVWDIEEGDLTAEIERHLEQARVTETK